MENRKIYAKIAGVGFYVPEKVLTNDDLCRMVDTTDEWIVKRTGIKKRHIAAEQEATSDLAAEAAKRALAAANVRPEELDCIIVGTCTPDMFFPSTACLVQKKIGAGTCGCYDVSAACSGMIYALSAGNAYIQSGQYKTVLVIGADTLSKMVDFTDRATCVLFGDGAGAMVLQASDQPGIEYVELGADGNQSDILVIPAGGSRMPATHETVDKKLHYVQAAGREVFKLAVRVMEELVVEALKRSNLRPEDIDLLIPHQANMRIIEAGQKRLGLSSDRVLANIDQYGNTTAATIPIGLAEAIDSGRAKPGDRILMVSFGAGFTWAIMIARL